MSYITEQYREKIAEQEQTIADLRSRIQEAEASLEGVRKHFGYGTVGERDALRSQNSELQKRVAELEECDAELTDSLNKTLEYARTLAGRRDVHSVEEVLDQFKRERDGALERVTELEEKLIAEFGRATEAASELDRALSELVAARKDTERLIEFADPVLKYISVGLFEGSNHLWELRLEEIPVYRPIESANKQGLMVLFTLLRQAREAIDQGRAAIPEDAGALRAKPEGVSVEEDDHE